MIHVVAAHEPEKAKEEPEQKSQPPTPWTLSLDYGTRPWPWMNLRPPCTLSSRSWILDPLNSTTQLSSWAASLSRCSDKGAIMLPLLLLLLLLSLPASALLPGSALGTDGWGGSVVALAKLAPASPFNSPCRPRCHYLPDSSSTPLACSPSTSPPPPCLRLA